MIALWEDPPTAIGALAKRAESPAFARWLRQAAKATCSREIYDVANFEHRAFLQFELGESATRVPRPWTVLIDCRTSPVPRGCPSALKSVYALVGGLCTQYGAGNMLISPPDLEPASRMGAIRSKLEPTPPFDITDAAALWSFLETNARKAKAAKTEVWWKSLDLGFDVTTLVPVCRVMQPLEG
jgi:hypothetical protein